MRRIELDALEADEADAAHREQRPPRPAHWCCWCPRGSRAVDRGRHEGETSGNTRDEVETCSSTRQDLLGISFFKACAGTPPYSNLYRLHSALNRPRNYRAVQTLAAQRSTFRTRHHAHALATCAWPPERRAAWICPKQGRCAGIAQQASITSPTDRGQSTGRCNRPPPRTNASTLSSVVCAAYGREEQPDQSSHITTPKAHASAGFDSAL